MPQLLHKAKNIAEDLITGALNVGDRMLTKVGGLLGKTDSSANKVGEHEHKKAAGYLEKGRKSYNQKYYDDAVKLFKKAIDSDPDYAHARYYYGLALYKLDQAEDAIVQWRIIASKYPQSPYADKAERKIAYVKTHLTRVVGELESRLKD